MWLEEGAETAEGVNMNQEVSRKIETYEAARKMAYSSAIKNRGAKKKCCMRKKGS